MKITTLQSLAGQEFPAVLDDDGGHYWSIAELIPGFGGGVLEVIGAWDELRPLLESPPTTRHRMDGVQRAAPIRLRRNIFCVGKNYREHAMEFSKSGFDNLTYTNEFTPEAPIIFTKSSGTVIGPGDPIPAHNTVTQQLDYEAELAVVIGRGGIGIAKERAMQHVWGYTIANDVTARDLQKHHRQWFLGKSLDGFCPLGPWLVTGDAFNLGEVTVTRATLRVRSAEGRATVGMAVHMGRDKVRATLAALADALLQMPAFEGHMQQHVIEPLSARIAESREQKQARAAATKVEFFTMVRGD